MPARLDAYGERLDRIADLLRELVLQTPRMSSQATGARRCRSCCAQPGRRPAAPARHELAARAAARCSRTSAGDYLDGWFESDPIKAVYGFDGIVGNYASPYTPGSAYVLLHHVFGEVNGKKGAWGHAIGGMGAITQAMARRPARAGCKIRVDTPVREILVERGRAVGAVTEAGECFRACRDSLQSESRGCCI